MEKQNLIAETLERLKQIYSTKGIKPGKLRSIVVKPQWTCVLGTENRCGMSINFTGIHSICDDSILKVDSLKSLIDVNLFEVVGKLMGSGEMHSRATSIAALSALSQPFLTAESLRERGFHVQREGLNNADFINKDDIVGVVGYGGFIRNLIGRCKELKVTEMRPLNNLRTLVIGREVTYSPSVLSLYTDKDNREVLSKSDVALITASSIINDTFEELFEYSRRARVKGLYGPSASFIPDVAFEKGIDFVMSVRVTDSKRFEFDAINSFNMEAEIKKSQTHQVIRRKE